MKSVRSRRLSPGGEAGKAVEKGELPLGEFLSAAAGVSGPGVGWGKPVDSNAARKRV